jgi:DNA polymerase
MTVHDEAVAEEIEGTKSIKEFEQLLCDLPKWAEGFPLASEGFVCKRYKK